MHSQHIMHRSLLTLNNLLWWGLIFQFILNFIYKVATGQISAVDDIREEEVKGTEQNTFYTNGTAANGYVYCRCITANEYVYSRHITANGYVYCRCITASDTAQAYHTAGISLLMGVCTGGVSLLSLMGVCTTGVSLANGYMCSSCMESGQLPSMLKCIYTDV